VLEVGEKLEVVLQGFSMGLPDLRTKKKGKHVTKALRK